jgi:aminopeptidase N
LHWLPWLLLVGCSPASAAVASMGDTDGAKSDDVDEPGQSPIVAEWDRDILDTRLEIDLQAQRAVARITVAGSAEAHAASFEVDGLRIDAVRHDGTDLPFEVADGNLHVATEVHTEPLEVEVEYGFAAVDGTMNGWDPQRGVTFLWPYFCSSLFPCHSDPSDGLRFELAVTGVPEGQTAVFPERIPSDAPSYQPAIAIGDFTQLDLGTTDAGTEVSVWFLPGGRADATSGTEHLVEVFDFLERTYGPYSFGEHVGSVSADWGGGDFGGMEHHPYWHVSSGSMHDPIVHAHEAAHGWFGDGVRIACWEDFVLSEGVTTYLAARALEEAGFDAWSRYACRLRDVCMSSPPIVSPDVACNSIDLLHSDLWSSAPYMKGAFFLRAVSERIGVDVLDDAVSSFYLAHEGRAATMDELVAALATLGEPGEIEALAQSWLQQAACPTDDIPPC